MTTIKAFANHVTATLTVKEKIFLRLDDLESGCLRIKRGDNAGALLGHVFVWQEVFALAKEKLRRAWGDIVAEGIISDDATLREEGANGIVAEGGQFSVVVTVSKPRQIFSRDKFIAAVAKQYKLDPAQLETIAKNCMTDSAPPLHKQVLEA